MPLCGIFFWQDEEEHIRLHCPSKASYRAILKSESEGDFTALICENCKGEMANFILFIEAL